ncbi:energy transducer TonB [Methylovorus sp. SPW-M1]
MNKKSFCLLLILLNATQSYAAEIKKPEMVESPPFIYPVEAYQAGHQGLVLVEVRILANDTIETPTIKKSSRSEILDKAAITLVEQSKFLHGSDKDGKPADLVVVVPVEFNKDSSANLNIKTCADYVADYQWFTQTFPESKLSDMRLYKLTLGLLTVRMANVDDLLRLSKSYTRIYQKTYADCYDNRDQMFMTTLKDNMKWQ